MPTGCGLAVMHGFYYFRLYEHVMKCVTEALINFYHADGCAIIASMGNSEWEKCPFLEDLGFTRVSEYWNMAHPGLQDKQSIWIKPARAIIRNKDGSIEPRK
jgi:hypothetical protein